MRSFGVARREGYDSEGFYARALYREETGSKDVDPTENPVPPSVLNTVQCRDSRSLDFLPDRSVHLMVTSPPYNVGKDYDADLSLSEYLDLLQTVFRECYRVLVAGGRACVNVANLGRKPYIPVHKYIVDRMESLGFLMRGEIIWDKSASAGTSTAWGSWKSASNPTLRDVHEYILVFCKESFRRIPSEKQNTIDGEGFLSSTRSIWSFPAESAKRVGHPAPFPVELPYRLIQLYTFQGDVVLDPFGGSGSTAIAALRSGRDFVLCDSSEEYAAKAGERIRRFREHGADDLKARKRI